MSKRLISIATLAILLASAAFGMSRPAHAADQEPILRPGETLWPGQMLISDWCNYVLVMQHDGNLVEEDPVHGWHPIWASGTWGNPESRLVAQGDGNFVIVTADGRPIWSTDTWGYSGTVLIMQNDGNVVAYALENNPIWSSWGGNVTKHSLALQILNNGGIDKSGRQVLQDLQDTAAGRIPLGGYALSTAILRLIVVLGQHHSMQITALESGGWGHSPDSRHYTGDAVDIDKLDNQWVTGRNAPSITIINTLAGMMPYGSRFGQWDCPGHDTPPLPPGITTIHDYCTHLHIDVPVGTP